jgi:CheY-like chemotaxis protein
MSLSQENFKDLPRFTLLVIDDNPNNLTIAFEHLEGEGYNVLTAKNGESGLKRAKSTQPDLISLDLRSCSIL